MTDPELDALITRLRAETFAGAHERVWTFLRLGGELWDAGHTLQARRIFGELLADGETLPDSELREQALSTACER